MPQARRRVTFSRPPIVIGVSQACSVETQRKVTTFDSGHGTSQEIEESTNLMGVTMTMPEGRAIWDSGAALDCIGEVAVARTAQANTA